MLDVVGVAGHHEEQQRVALDVAQEAQSEPLTLGGSLDDAWDVGHDERLLVAIAHDAQRGLHGGEGVVGNLRAGIAECRQQGGFAGIGKSYQSDVSQQLEFEDDGHLLHGLAGLCVARRLIGG